MGVLIGCVAKSGYKGHLTARLVLQSEQEIDMTMRGVTINQTHVDVGQTWDVRHLLAADCGGCGGCYQLVRTGRVVSEPIQRFGVADDISN